MTTVTPIDGRTASPVEQIPSASIIRRRLADLAQERSLLRQLLRVAVRRERESPMAPVHQEEARS
jgi:hypothetical protein